MFCQIASGARPVEIVHESRTTIAFLEPHPVSPGQTLLVPRSHVATLLQLPDGAAGSFFASLLEVSEDLTGALRPAGLQVSWTEGSADGGHGSHLHARLVPRFRGGLSGMEALGEGAYREHLAEIASIIRRRRGGPRGERASRLVPRRTATRGAAAGDGNP